ncbi:lysophospholipid acyltransferase family protein [Geodermatophilus sp. SYSU D00691]
MSAWLPVNDCRAACADDPVPQVDAATRRRRTRRLAGAVLTGAVRTGLRPTRRALVCAAAGVLTALGMRVEVHSPAVAWPRPGTGRLVVSNHVSWLDDLALQTVVPGAPVSRSEVAGWPVVGRVLARSGGVFLDRGRLRSLPGSVREVADRLRAGATVLVHPEGTAGCGVQLGRFRPALFQAAVDSGAAVCPVAIRYRTEPGGDPTAVAGYLADDPLWRSIRRVVATRGLVLEVHLLPALAPAAADRRTLAALAEYAVAAVTETRPPVVAAHPRPARLPGVLPAAPPRSPRRPRVLRRRRAVG